MNLILGKTHVTLGCTAVFFSYPLDLLRVRLAFENSNIRTTVTSILNEEPNLGKLLAIRHFYHGFMPTMYGMIPYAGVSFLTYETLKDYALGLFNAPMDNRKVSNSNNSTTDCHQVNATPVNSSNLEISKSNTPRQTYIKHLPPHITLLCGAISGMIAQTFSYPLEVIRRQMQISGHTKTYRNTIETYRNIIKTRGGRGLWVGLTIGYLKITPMFAVSFFSYEYLKEMMNID